MTVTYKVTEKKAFLRNCTITYTIYRDGKSRKQPKQERDDIHFTHIAIPTSFYILYFILTSFKIVILCVSVYSVGMCVGDDVCSGVAR